MKDENSVPAAQKMTDVSLSIFRSKFKKTRIQMIDYNILRGHRERKSSRRIFVICHFSFGDRPLGAPSSTSMASDTGAPLTFPHCNQRARLFEAIEPTTIKRPRKGKTSITKFVFFGKFAKPGGSHSQENQDPH